MPNFEAVVNTDFGELHVEAETVKELQARLKELGIKFEAGKVGIIAPKPGGAKEDDSCTTSESRLPKRIPESLVGKLPDMTNSDIATAILFYELEEATKEQILERSRELGKPISTDWAKKNFYRDLKGSVVAKRKDGKTVYWGLSDKGRLDTKQRLDQLLSAPNQKN